MTVYRVEMNPEQILGTQYFRGICSWRVVVSRMSQDANKQVGETPTLLDDGVSSFLENGMS